MTLELRNDFFILMTFRDCLKVPYRSVFRSVSGVRKLWREILQLTGDLERVLAAVDLSGFNPSLGLDDELVIPDIAYPGEDQERLPGVFRGMKRLKSPGTGLLSEDSETKQKLLRGVRTGGGGFLEKSPPGRRRPPAVQLKSLDQKRNRQYDGKVETKDLQKGDRQDKENLKGPRAAGYISTLVEKQKRNRNNLHNPLLFEIFDSAFKQPVHGPQARVSSFSYPAFSDFTGKRAGPKGFQGPGEKIKEFESSTDELNVKKTIKEEPDQFDAREPDRFKYEPGKSMSTASAQQVTDHLSGGDSPQKSLDVSSLPKGFQLLEILTRRWNETFNQVIVKDGTGTLAQTVPVSDYPGTAPGGAARMGGDENIKNLVNLTVQLQDSGPGEEDLENIGEKVNRILMEQARRYGIDLT